MNDNFTSLVFFTVLCQTAVGALIFRELVLLRGGDEMATFDFERISIMVIFLILAISLAIAFLHLGNPFHAYNALNNLRRSWLSREILSLSILMISLLSYLIFTSKANYEKSELTFSVISIMAGISLIYCMIKLYMIPSITSWNNPFTPLSFLITTFLCGIPLVTIIYGKTNAGSISMAIPLITAFILSSLINSIFSPRTFSEQNLCLLIIRTSISVLSLLIIGVIYFRTQSNKTFILWVILFISVISSEILNRYIFFLSFEKSGL